MAIIPCSGCRIESLLKLVPPFAKAFEHGYMVDYETVFVEKTKTTWYVLVRVLREVVKGCDNILA